MLTSVIYNYEVTKRKRQNWLVEVCRQNWLVEEVWRQNWLVEVWRQNCGRRSDWRTPSTWSEKRQLLPTRLLSSQSSWTLSPLFLFATFISFSLSLSLSGILFLLCESLLQLKKSNKWRGKREERISSVYN